MFKSCPYCDEVPTKFPLTFMEDMEGVYHTHMCPLLKRELEEYRAWKVEIGDPYFAKDAGALERRLRYLKSKKLIP